MYLARKVIRQKSRYYIRESYADNGGYKSRDLFDLGNDPSRYIIYPGGHGYYYDESVEAALNAKGLHPRQDDLDNIFWDFLDPEIRRVIEGFDRSRAQPRATVNRCDFGEETVQSVHLFDKRRVLYLKSAQIDQRHIHRVSPRFFAACHNKSRDELEQAFMVQERILAPRERASYVYVIFDLQRFFTHPDARKMPDSRQLKTFDDFFIEALCRLNDDVHFWAGMPVSDRLQDYLIRYAVMFFDFDLPRRSPAQDSFWEFVNRHRRYRTPRKVRIKMEEAGRLFCFPWRELKAMDREALTRLYRKMALKHHPDCGGDPETFIRLTTIYEALMAAKTG
jgi:hypothetical protein